MYLFEHILPCLFYWIETVLFKFNRKNPHLNNSGGTLFNEILLFRFGMSHLRTETNPFRKKIIGVSPS